MGIDEQRRPARIGGRADEDVALAQIAVLAGVEDDAGRSGGDACGHGFALQFGRGGVLPRQAEFAEFGGVDDPRHVEPLQRLPADLPLGRGRQEFLAPALKLLQFLQAEEEHLCARIAMRRASSRIAVRINS